MMQHVTSTRVVLVAVTPRSKLRWAFSAVSTHCRWGRRWCRRRRALLLVTRAVAVRNSAWFILWTGCIAGIINFVVFVTLAHFLIMVHLTFQIKDLYLEVLDELLNRINWCWIDPPSKTTVFWSIGRLQNKFHVRCLIEDKEMKQPSITHACGHLKKRRPPSIPSVHICTKQSSPCLHFGHGSLRLSYCRRGVSLVNSLLCCGGNSNTGSGKESGPRGPSHIMGSPFLPPFPFPKP